MSLSDSLKKLKIDTRMTDWYLKNNLMTQQELEKYLSEVPDSSANIYVASAEEEEVDQDSDFDADEAH